MLIFKFGGASVKNPEAVSNLAEIVRFYDKKLVVVVSAMGKMTNALEKVADHYFNDRPDRKDGLDQVKDYHFSIVRGLFSNNSHSVYSRIHELFESLLKVLDEKKDMSYDCYYDQVVSFGELFSTVIVSEYLNEAGIKTRWIDIREVLKTDARFREGRIIWEISESLVKKEFTFYDEDVLLTQGFLGSTLSGLTTTLGREGSDYTAAILAYILDADKVVIWKDVPGVLNADPKWFDNTVLLEHLSYKDAIELAYYGAKVIHPKTIQPLKNKNIVLHVKSFVDPKGPGTVIGNEDYDRLEPSFIFKMDQVLISISSKDFSFIAENNLEQILGIFARKGFRINLMQNTAVSFQVCVNNDRTRLPSVIESLEEHFNVIWMNGLELITIRYYDEPTIERVLVNKDRILEQRTRETIQMVVKDRGES